LVALAGCAEARNPQETKPERPIDVPVTPPPPACLSAECVPARPTVLEGPATFADKAPPPISGGTLLASRDGTLVFAADPERDQVYVVDAAKKQLLFTQPLRAGDEPGRMVEDADGRIHVALRGGRAVATLSRDGEREPVRRELCDLPRGLGYDAASDQIVLACAEGKLVRAPADPARDDASAVEIVRGARDVIVRPGEVWLSYFRSAALVKLNADGSIQSAYAPPKFTSSAGGATVVPAIAPAASSSVATTAPPPPSTPNVATPTTAWRAIDVPGRGVAMLHQRANQGDVVVGPGGYGGGKQACTSGIVRSALTFGVEQDSPLSVDLVDATLAVDMAIDPGGTLMAIVSPGNWTTRPQLQVHELGDAQATPRALDGQTVFVNDPGAPCLDPVLVQELVSGQATAVTFVSGDLLAVQAREPAAISFIDPHTKTVVARVDLQQPSTFDTGHALFHLSTTSGIACASCHAEAGDDGHVWSFQGIGPRRTQNLRGGILDTAPFHWDGDMTDIPTLVHEVYVRRMGGFAPSDDQDSALALWLDHQPAFVTEARDADAAARGDELFHSDAVGCATCHSGPHFTNGGFADVGKGVSLQVPSLRGVSFRVPLMHDGCAQSLRERFDPACGGGDAHGHTSQLEPAQIDDLVAYLETL
jgi:mono/diheme cytochrome c family protein